MGAGCGRWWDEFRAAHQPGDSLGIETTLRVLVCISDICGLKLIAGQGLAVCVAH